MGVENSLHLLTPVTSWHLGAEGDGGGAKGAAGVGSGVSWGPAAPSPLLLRAGPSLFGARCGNRRRALIPLLSPERGGDDPRATPLFVRRYEEAEDKQWWCKWGGGCGGDYTPCHCGRIPLPSFGAVKVRKGGWPAIRAGSRCLPSPAPMGAACQGVFLIRRCKWVSRRGATCSWAREENSSPDFQPVRC